MTQKYLIGQRFEVGDRVLRKTLFSSTEDFIKRYGRVKEVLLKQNRKGTSSYYYEILWNDNKSSEHAQHTLIRAIS